MANYTLTHTGAQVDDAVEKVVNPYENVTLTVNASRLANLSYTARYYKALKIVFVRIYGTVNASMNAGYDYDLLNIGSRAPSASAALAVHCGKKASALAKSNGVITIKPLESGIQNYDVYIGGFWYV